jgi:hypothetical protein
MKRRIAVSLLLASLAAACGSNPQPSRPASPVVTKRKVETEEERATKRLAAVHQIVPEGASCLPETLKDPSFVLEVGVSDDKPVLCASDADGTRALGIVGCWQVSVTDGDLSYVGTKPLPGRSVLARPDGRCVRGYCLPTASSPGEVVDIAWSTSGGEVAVNTRGQAPAIHIFSSDDRSHKRAIALADGEAAIAGRPEGLLFVGDTIYVAAMTEEPSTSVWSFRTDGSALGQVKQLGDKASVSLLGGSAMVFGEGNVAFSEHGLTTLTTVEQATGKRIRIVRKTKKGPCKATELDGYFAGATVSARCKDHLDTHFEPFVGATMVPGKNNHLVLLRGSRLGEFAIVDGKTLEEKKQLPAQWCPPDAEEPEESEAAAE